jgi:hypothetical protein
MAITAHKPSSPIFLMTENRLFINFIIAYTKSMSAKIIVLAVGLVTILAGSLVYIFSSTDAAEDNDKSSNLSLASSSNNNDLDTPVRQSETSANKSTATNTLLPPNTTGLDLAVPVSDRADSIEFGEEPTPISGLLQTAVDQFENLSQFDGILRESDSALESNPQAPQDKIAAQQEKAIINYANQTGVLLAETMSVKSEQHVATMITDGMYTPELVIADYTDLKQDLEAVQPPPELSQAHDQVTNAIEAYILAAETSTVENFSPFNAAVIQIQTALNNLGRQLRESGIVFNQAGGNYLAQF